MLWRNNMDKSICINVIFNFCKGLGSYFVLFLYFPSVLFVLPIPQFSVEHLTSQRRPASPWRAGAGPGSGGHEDTRQPVGHLPPNPPADAGTAGLWRAVPGPPSGLRNGQRRRTTWKRKTGFGQENSRKKV